MGADDKAGQHIDALAQRLHQFGRHTKERKMEWWHWLSNAMDLAGVECQLAKNQEICEDEYNKFVNELFIFVNKELDGFRCSNALVSRYAQATS